MLFPSAQKKKEKNNFSVLSQKSQKTYQDQELLRRKLTLQMCSVPFVQHIMLQTAHTSADERNLDFKESSINFIFSFLNKKQPNIVKTINADTKSTDMIFRDPQKIFIS